ncbi:N-acetylglucosamine kinase [Actinoplanes sp. NPDC049599]|uniref:N-acetylglucosamine kinase n=1 Tax=Actinoplanes sp. NPDC049599 TaxID=3363903 RepID=UPI003793A43F
MSRSLVVGVDAGATSTRCVVATLDGIVLGRGAAGGANRNSSGGDAAEPIAAALTAALSGVDTSAVRVGVLGAAGSAGVGRAAFRAAATRAWSRCGAGGEVVTVTDLEVAFAAGTAGADGVLLLSGTGALAARFAGGVIERRCDGYGWLLGDEGSAVWIGVRALRAVLAALDGRGEPTALTDAVAERLGAGLPGPLSRARREELAQALVAAGFARPPAELGRLAPAVSAASDAGDPVARRITDAAAAKLLHTYDTVAPPPDVVALPPGVVALPPGVVALPPGVVALPPGVVAPPGGVVGALVGVVVLAGSVLLTPGPVARAVRAGVLARTGAEPREAADGAAGAAALALARLTGGPVPAAVHARLTRRAPAHDPRRE